MKYLDYFYKLITEFLTDLGQVLYEVITDVISWTLIILIIGTFPIWLPIYLIIKKKKEGKLTMANVSLVNGHIDYEEEILHDLAKKIKDFARENNLTIDEVLDLIKERLGG